MNDPRELQYSHAIIDAVVRSCIPEHADQLLRDFSTSFPLVLSFSAGADLLSQWRGYADGGRGFSLGIQTESMQKWRALQAPQAHNMEGEQLELLFLGPRFDPVSYKRDDQEREVRAACERYKQGNRDKRSLGLLRGELLLLAPFMKDAGFSEEAEWRLASSLLSMDKGQRYSRIHHPEFMVARTEVRQFERLPIKAPNDKNYGYGPVLDLVQTGPQNRSHDRDVRDYILRSQPHWPHVQVVSSKVPFSAP